MSTFLVLLYNFFCALCDAVLTQYIHVCLWIKDHTVWVHQIRNKIVCIRSEPEEQKWVSLSCILETNKDYNMFYYDDPNSVFFRWFIYSNFNDNYEWFEEYIPRIEFDKTMPIDKYYKSRIAAFHTESVHRPLIIVKQDSEHQVVKLITPTLTITGIDHTLFFKSNVSFLSILYVHPHMKGEIALKIPKSCLYVGNQILSAVFIYRLLEYTVGYMFYFDMNYRVKILDNNMKYMELCSNEYIELEHNSYVKRTV